jgi:hypothetical protein
LVFEKNANFFAQNRRKPLKIVIITSTPGLSDFSTPIHQFSFFAVLPFDVISRSATPDEFYLTRVASGSVAPYLDARRRNVELFGSRQCDPEPILRVTTPALQKFTTQQIAQLVLRIKIIFHRLKNAVAFYNAGVVHS